MAIATALSMPSACGEDGSETTRSRAVPSTPTASTSPRAERVPASSTEGTSTPRAFGYAVLPAGTPMRTIADPAAPASPLPALPTHESVGPLPAAPRGSVVMVSGLEGELLAVETLGLPANERHCEHPLAAAEHFRLRLFVPADAPLTVATRSVHHAGEADTSVTVHPGTPLVRTALDTWVVDAEGVRVALPIPDDARGRFYLPSSSTHFVAPPYARLPEATVLRFDGAPLQGIERLPGAPRPLVLVREDPVEHGDGGERDEALVQVQTRCMDLQLRSDHATSDALGPASTSAPSASIEDPATVALASAAAGGGASPFAVLVAAAHEVRPGATIYWEDGRIAGQVVASHRFDAEAETIAGRLCFVTPLVDPDGLRLCFDRGEVQAIEAPLPAVGTAPIPSSPYLGLGLVRSSSGRVPRVRMAKATVDGELDRDIVRRIVRAHLNEVRYCYDQGLARDPSLEGRLTIRFVVSAPGTVPAAVVESSTLPDPAVPGCIARAIKRWKFPKPSDGSAALVTYPFVLSPG